MSSNTLSTNSKILICTDLDRTLIPNGDQPESKGARELFARLARHKAVNIAYVSGRHRELIDDAVDKYQLPQPDYVVGDVGTSIYFVTQGDWHLQKEWHELIAKDWNNYSSHQIAAEISDIVDFKLQEPEKQNSYKLSYYTQPDIEIESVRIAIHERLKRKGINANLVWSVDEQANQGLLDVIPQNAGKYQAIEYIIRYERYSEKRTVFAGDSGNDLDVLVSPIQSVLVANAPKDVRELAIKQSYEKGTSDTLYLAKDGYREMNGNYAAGIIQGVLHYLPELEDIFT